MTHDLKEQLEAYFEAFWDPIVIIDNKFRIFQVNKKFRELSGYDDKQELIGKSPSLILEKFEGDFPVNSKLKINLASFEKKILEMNLHSKFGFDIAIKITFQTFYIDTNDNWFLAGFIRDISHETHLIRQLNSIKEYALATNQISSIVFKQTEMGPTTLIRDEHYPFLREKFNTNLEIENEILRIGLTLTTALGQGESYTTGVSDLPLLDHNIIAVCYTKILKNPKAIDERLQRNTYVIIAIFFPKKLSSLIAKRSELEEIFEEHFRDITTFEQFNLELLKKLKFDLLFIDSKVEVPK